MKKIKKLYNLLGVSKNKTHFRLKYFRVKFTHITKLPVRQVGKSCCKAENTWKKSYLCSDILKDHSHNTYALSCIMLVPRVIYKCVKCHVSALKYPTFKENTFPWCHILFSENENSVLSLLCFIQFIGYFSVIRRHILNDYTVI